VTAEDPHDIFAGHLLAPANQAPIIKPGTELIWPSVMLVLCLVLLAAVKYTAYPKLLRIIQSTFSKQILQQLEREEQNSMKFYSVALSIFFALNLAFLIYRLNDYYHVVLADTDGFTQFVFFFFCILLLWGFKKTVNVLLSVFTDTRRLFSDYDINSTLVDQTFGLFLFPWVVLIQFSDFEPRVFLIGAATVLCVAILVKWYRGMIMGLIEERVGLLQIFSYFCGLEILPFFVMVKYIIETF
jgi:hypothetical protein